jgi:large subunit ribosomal protein L20
LTGERHAHPLRRRPPRRPQEDDEGSRWLPRRPAQLKRAEKQAFVGRKLKKRDMRSLWITRLNIASRAQGLPYSRLIAGLAKADIRLDRKQLSELAIHQPEAFAQIVAQAKAALG